MKFSLLAFPIIFCLLLGACGSSSNQSSDGITPFPGVNDLKDEVLKEAIVEFIQLQGAPPNSEYDYARVDLNGDGRRDGLVLFKLPHTHWCGWDGCGMAVFKASNKKFTPLATVSNVRGPLYVSATGNQGWRDIIVRVSGTNMRDKNVIMRFNGRTYPNSPLLAKTLQRPLSSLQTEKFFQ